MKRILSCLIALFVIASNASAFDFSAVAPSGQTLYFNIVDGNAQVTYQNTSYPYYTTYPTGSMTIPGSVTYNGTTYSVTSIGNVAFAGCSGLTSVNIPNSVTAIGESAFSGCSGLTSITIPNSVTSIGIQAFKGCSGLTSTVVQSGNTVYDCRGNCNAIIETSSNTLIQGCVNTVIPNSVTTIGCFAFEDCTGLTFITIPNSVTDIKAGAFSGCTGLTSVTIPESVTSIRVYEPIDGMECGYMEGAFRGCTGLTEVNFNATNCTSYGRTSCEWNNYYTFQDCPALTTINIGENVNIISPYLFYGCMGLTSVILPNSVITIDMGAFSDCSGLTSVTIGNSVTTIGGYAFSGCNGLTGTLTIPNSVTTIGNHAFDSCSGFTGNLTIPNSVTSIGDYAFYNCSGITEIHSLNNVPPTAYSTTFNGIPTNIPVYIPCGRLSYYTSATGWSQFTNFVEGSAYDFSAVSNNVIMGTVQILTMPTCSNPQAVVYAVANSGYQFDHWSDNSTSNPYSLTVNEDIELTAYFVPDGGGDQPSTDAPSIACVGVDMNNHNVVRWTPREGATSVVRYNIYRDGLGGYSQVGYVNHNGTSDYSWVDDNSNTATQPYSYKISEVYSDGTESDLSAPHTTMHLQISQGQGNTWNLSWTPYVGFNYDGYRIFRGTTAGSMSLLTSLSTANTTYSDANGTANTYYQIEVVPSSSTKSITVASRSNIASAAAPTTYTLTVASANTAMGTATGGGTYQPGAQATITATALDGYRFVNWSDGSTQASRTITVTGDATYTAYFEVGQGGEPQQYVITVVSNNPERGTVTGGGLYDAGAVITITAEPFAGYEFVQWHDGNTQDFRTITVTADATYTAYFRVDGSQGIEEISSEDVKVFAHGMEIVVEGADNSDALIYDVMGRIVHKGRIEGPIHVNSMGVYMVKIGNGKAHKVTVRP